MYAIEHKGYFVISQAINILQKKKVKVTCISQQKIYLMC